MIIPKWVSSAYLPKLAKRKKVRIGTRVLKDNKFSCRLKNITKSNELSTSWVLLQIAHLLQFDQPTDNHLCLNLLHQQRLWHHLINIIWILMKMILKSRCLWCFCLPRRQRFCHLLGQFSVRAPNVLTRRSGNQHRVLPLTLLILWRKDRRRRS